MSEALDKTLAAISEFGGDDDWRLRATAAGLIRGYDARWGAAQSRIVLHEVEREITSPLFNVDTERKSRTFSVAGKLDKLCEHDGYCLYDHKTTSQDIADPNAPYWRQLIVEGQPTHYELLLLLNGQRITRAVWDVVRKPGIRPRKIQQKELAELVSLHTYHHSPVSDETITQATQLTEENEELFAARLAEEAIAEPDRYFQRRSVPNLTDELTEYGRELWQIADEIRSTANTNRWFRNSSSCFQWSTPCEYLGICSGYDTEYSDKWQRADSVHEELPSIGDGRNVLTNSSIKCYQSCRRKYFYRYQLGLRRVDEEDKEALRFGSLWHSALDVYWTASCLKGSDNGSCASATSAVARASEVAAGLSG